MTRTHTHTQERKRDENQWWRVKEERWRRKMLLWGGMSARQRELESNGTHTSICQCDEISYRPQSHTPHCLLMWHLKHLFFLSLPSSPVPTIHLCPYFSSYFLHRLSLRLRVISIWHTVNQGVSSGPLSDLSSSPAAPLCSGLSIREPLPRQMPLTQFTQFYTTHR